MSILTMHHGLMAGIKQGDPPGYVTIGGRLYRTVTIGTQTWMAENLDYKFDGCIIGQAYDNQPGAGYLNNDEATYGIDGTYKCGLLYSYTAVKLLDDNRATLCPGWHVPSKSELETLVTTVGGTDNAGTKLKAIDYSITSTWPHSWNGTDDYGFGMIPAGTYQDPRLLGLQGNLWSSTYDTSVWYHYYLNFSYSSRVTMYSSTSAYYRYSVRLVKDVT